MSKILLYQEPTSGVTTNGTQHAFYIDENGIPTVKNGSQVIQFGTSGYAFAGSSGSSGMNGTNGLSGTSGISGTSGQDGAPGDIGPSGSSGSSGMSGTSGINGIDGATGISGTSGVDGTFFGSSGSSGANGSNGIGIPAGGSTGQVLAKASATDYDTQWVNQSGGGGGSVDLINLDVKNAPLDRTQTIANGYSYLHGFFGNGVHWGTDANRNYEFGHTYPVVLPTAASIDYVYFPIQYDVADTPVTFKVVVWDRKPGTYYPNNKLAEETFTFQSASTGYKFIAYNLDWTNTGYPENHFFISLVGYDATGTAYRFRQSVIQFYYDTTYGLINLSNGDVPSNYLHGVTTVFNSDWVASGAPATYGAGWGNGSIQFVTPFIPFFYNIVP